MANNEDLFAGGESSKGGTRTRWITPFGPGDDQVRIPKPIGSVYADQFGGPAYGEIAYETTVDENGNIRRVPRSSTAEQDVSRYRSMGEERSSAPAIDTRQSNQTRGLQMGSLAGLATAAHGKSSDMLPLAGAAQGTSQDMLMAAGAADGRTADMARLSDASRGETTDMRLLSDAASGAAPSRAEILGRQMSDRALRGQVSAAGNVRGGPAASAAAFRFASQNAAAQRADMNQGIQAERAAELDRARGAFSGAMGAARRDLSTAQGTARGQYLNAAGSARRDYSGAMGAARRDHMSGATGIRGQDIGQATDQARLVGEERDRAQRNQQFYEELAHRTRVEAMNASQRNMQSETNQRNTDRAMQNSEDQATWNKFKDVASIGVGGATGAMGGATDSDIKTKEPVTWGSLAPITWGTGTKAGEIDHTDKHEAPKDEPVRDTIGTYADGIVRNLPEDDEPTYRGVDIVREDPYMTSDDKAKLAKAWEEGHKSATADVANEFARLSKMPPQELKDLSEANQLARAVRDTKTSAWDEGRIAARPDVARARAEGAKQMGDRLAGSDKIWDASASTLKAPVRTYALEKAGMDMEPDYATGLPRKMLTDIQNRGTDAATSVLKRTSGTDPKPGPAPSPQQGYASRVLSYIRSDERTKNVSKGDVAMAGAARSMEAQPYAYKAQFRPETQSPGELNIGPMANEMAKDPVARTAIVRDGDTGMLAIDKDKGMKVMMGSLASLQHQIDALKGDVPRADSAKEARRARSAHA